ncbi:S9 family peptidase [Actinokineospora bangkokensis]|uniref:S9 family peptidase n=1 Tax=Actinokineospora bangkokensis TaxID=1193682 RepID=A0A1Q9LSN9_9PSEU|nr:prolyl oligopeptidase family serine peptidase [Actinokineospora bangkokensis]OLR95004.1 S9 family peptidase [Actinokineospora bangkokensis]
MTSDTFLRLQARTQRFTLGTPRGFSTAPDGSHVLFLRSAGGEDRTHALWVQDLATGQETALAVPADLLAGGAEELSPEERARRERSRSQGAGILAAATDAAARTAAFTLSGRLFTADALTRETRELPATTPVIDPRPNPAGTHIAYVAGGALRVIGVDGADDRALAEPATADEAHGLAEFIAAEEMQRSRGYWWSPEGDRLLVAHTDNAPVQRWHIADPANPAAEPATVAYPAAGTPNATVRLEVIGLDGTRTPVAWDNKAFPYLVTAHWSRHGKPLIAVQTRDQRTVEVHAVDPATGATELLHTDTDDTWIEIFPGAPAWTPSGELVRIAAADGANRLFVGDTCVSGDLQVRSVLHVGDDVLFTASAEDPTQVHVYTSGPTRVSTEDGVHTAARAGGTTVLVSSSLDWDGPRVRVLRDGEQVGEVAVLATTPPIRPNVQLLTVGERDLRVALLYPSDHTPGTKLPVLLDPYGGPHAQRVLSTRGAFLHPQWLADQGFAVLVADGRGTPGRGPAWERAIHHDFAGATLDDQVDALTAVAADHPDLDLTRVAIRGWSYGGYLSALAVLRRPDTFHAAISGAPVTDWRLYDTHYTERYLGHPTDHPDVYDRNSLIDDAPTLTRPLLLLHGLADDNVVVAHSLRLSTALVAAGRPHTLLPLPGVTHMTPQEDDVAENFMLLQLRWLREALRTPE